MRGELIGVWSETHREIWDELAAHEVAPKDMFCELYRELASSLKVQPSIENLADIIDDPEQSRVAFGRTDQLELAGERELIRFLESVHPILDDLGGDALANHYFTLLGYFMEKYSIRYDLRRSCTLCPTIPGVFASLFRDLRGLTARDAHLDSLMKDYENAVRDLRVDCSDGRIKTCIQKQVNLLEALGRACPGITKTTLGAICNELTIWPHEDVKESLKSLYRFSCDYPGIRHGGTPASAIRPIDMRDMVAMSILLAGFTPYLTDQFSATAVYGGI
jgi:hypothetical protein